MVLWRNWWTASSKMLINTLFYIAAFHFSPTNTALTLSVGPPSQPSPFCCRGYGYTDICNSISTPTPPCTKQAHQKKKKKIIILNQIQTHRVLVLVTFILIDTSRLWKQNKRWFMIFSAALDRRLSLRKHSSDAWGKSTRQNSHRIPDKCSLEELIFSMSLCILGKKMVCTEGKRDRGQLEEVYWSVPFAIMVDNDLFTEMEKS